MDPSKPSRSGGGVGSERRSGERGCISEARNRSIDAQTEGCTLLLSSPPVLLVARKPIHLFPFSSHSWAPPSLSLPFSVLPLPAQIDFIFFLGGGGRGVAGGSLGPCSPHLREKLKCQNLNCQGPHLGFRQACVHRRALALLFVRASAPVTWEANPTQP